MTGSIGVTVEAVVSSVVDPDADLTVGLALEAGAAVVAVQASTPLVLLDADAALELAGALVEAVRTAADHA